MQDLYYIAIEGVIGVGKTSLAKLLSKEMNALTVLEEVEANPFLSDFYHDRERFAFQTQIFFLLSRFRQQEEFPQPDLFHKRIISDYIFAKDKIFASLNLSDSELQLYEKLVRLLEPRVPIPDLVVYLQASPERLMHNIRIRDRASEKELSEDYLRELSEIYNRFFMNYNSTPLLVINSEKLDFVKKEEHLRQLMEVLEEPIKGTRFYNPLV